MLYQFLFACTFYIISHNQLENDYLTDLDLSKIRYQTFFGSLIYVWNLSMGDCDIGGYELGEASQASILYVMYLVSKLVMLVVLLNMLIAIMGNTFSV